LLAAFSGARLRIGARAERLSFLYNRRLVIATNGHAYDRFRLLLTGLGIELPAPLYQPVIQPSFKARASAMELWASAGLNESSNVIGLVSGADTNARGRWKPYLKRWKPERYAELARWITEETGAKPVMFGGPDEMDLAEQIATAAGVPIVNFCGKTGVGELPWLLQKCKAVVINDTGLMHLAAAVGTPVVALFGPTSPLAFAPKGEQHFVIQGHVHCSPCYPYPTCDLQGCGAMDDISTQHVKNSLRNLLSLVAGEVSSR
jgi:lipopolysaccharide heptosyltransferase II